MKFVPCLFLALALVGCGGGGASYSEPRPARQVRIEWLGHESFLFTSGLGLRILTNPHSPGTSSRSLPPKLAADILLITTERPAFNYDDALDNSPTTFRGAIAEGLLNAAGIRIRGVSTGDSGSNGSNIAYTWTFEGLRICFAGNIQRPFSPYELSLIGRADVLFLPVGIPGTLSDEGRSQVIAQLRPAVVVPMGPSSAIDRWAASWTRVHRLPGNVVFLSADHLSYNPTLLVFGS